MRIQDMIYIPSHINKTQQQVMHLLRNLSIVTDSDVFQLETSYMEDWNRIVQLMRLFADRENSIFEGSKPVLDPEKACKLKRIAIFMILEALSTLILENLSNSFYNFYWVMKTFGQIAMDFKDLDMAQKVFTKLKHQCQEDLMLSHKMVTYK